MITAPASFQAAQYRHTLEAARLAGLKVGEGQSLGRTGRGTCDIALFALGSASADAPLGISLLSISRYHRLGGGDLDAAIVYRALVQQPDGRYCCALRRRTRRHQRSSWFTRLTSLSPDESSRSGIGPRRHAGSDSGTAYRRVTAAQQCAAVTRQDRVSIRRRVDGAETGWLSAVSLVRFSIRHRCTPWLAKGFINLV